MKWSIALGTASGNDSDEKAFDGYHPTQWIAAQLLSLVENSGQRKFLIKPGASLLSQHLDGSGQRAQEAEEGIHIWVFNPSTLLTTARKPKPTRAVKVYYQLIGSQGEIDALGDIETVYLPEAIFKNFKSHLQEVNLDLPRDLRIWGGQWKTAWLERF